MGNIADPIIAAVASQRGLTALGTDSGTKPTQNQVLGWLDRCVWDLIVHCLQRWKEPGQLTGGRLDLLNKITQKEVATGTTGTPGTAPLPASAPMAEQYLSILVGTHTESDTYYESRRVHYGDFSRAVVNTIYTPAQAEPIYAFADGMLYYLPGDTHNRVDYHYIELPVPFSDAANDVWPLNDRLIPHAVFFAFKEMWKQLGDLGRAAAWEKHYQWEVQRVTGFSYKILEVWSG